MLLLLINMIPFRLFYRVYLKYFATRVILTIPCYYLYELVEALYKVNIQITITIVGQDISIISTMAFLIIPFSFYKYFTTFIIYFQFTIQNKKHSSCYAKYSSTNLITLIISSS